MRTNHWQNIARIITIAVASTGLVFGCTALNNSTEESSRTETQQQHENGNIHDHREVESEFDYLVHMIPHHQEAIDAANLLLERTERPEMEAFAEEIIETQTAEIEQIESWLDQWYPDRDRATDYEPMMRDLSDLEGDEFDQVFLEEMIIHHMGAVMQSQMLLQKNLVENEPVGELAQDIAEAQRDEIHQMQRWLQDWFDVDANEFMHDQMHNNGNHPMHEQRHEDGNGNHH